MNNDSETKAKLMASAKQEFMEKGYMKASLRSICKNAGVTTGALYFFFEDKEALFASLVEEPLNILLKVMTDHYAVEINEANQGIVVKEDFSEDMVAAQKIIHYMYLNYDAFCMLMTKAQGSRFENCVDQFVKITEKHYRLLADSTSKKLGCERLDDYLIRWSAYMHIDIFVYLLKNERSEKAALIHVDHIMVYLINGWYGLFKK